MTTLERINAKLTPYYSLFTMIIFFGSLFIGIYKIIIAPSDLKITVQDEIIAYPSSINYSFEKINSYLTQEDTLMADAYTIYAFLLKTTNYKKIVIENTTSKTLRGVKFRQLNTASLTGWSISSDFLTVNEEQELKKNLEFDEQDNIVYFKNVIDIAPQSQVYIHLWGSFSNSILGDELIVSYDNGDGYVEPHYTVDGLRGYFANYLFESLIVLLFIFVAVYIVGIKMARAR